MTNYYEEETRNGQLLLVSKKKLSGHVNDQIWIDCGNCLSHFVYRSYFSQKKKKYHGKQANSQYKF